MTRRRDISLTLALCLSLFVHAWIVYTVAGWYVRNNSKLFLPGLTRLAPVAQAPPASPVVVDRATRLGDGESLGAALANSPGDEAQQAQQASQEQASLSLDPSGDRGRSAASAPPSPARPPSPATPAFAAAPPASDARFEVPGSSAMPEGSPQFRVPPGKRRDEANPASEQPEPPTDAQPAERASAARPQPNPAPKSPADSASAPAAASSNSGDPAPQAESESDAFSTTPTADFRRGKTVARVGRKHKIINPRLEMAGYADLLQLSPPVTVVLRIQLKPGGDVEKVDIVKSSGSINVDVPTQQAAYKWWFEPARDRAGRPLPDVFEFVCRFT